jgi:hypothetical protein
MLPECSKPIATDDIPERCPNARISVAGARGWGPLSTPTPILDQGTGSVWVNIDDRLIASSLGWCWVG